MECWKCVDSGPFYPYAPTVLIFMQYMNDTHSTYMWYAIIPVAYFTTEVGWATISLVV